MIGRLRGTLAAKLPPQVLLDVQGVGYELDVPMSTLYQLPGLGEPAQLWTHLVVREDAHQLFGFATERERASFRQLIKVSGIGPRIALALLSGLSAEELARAVQAQDASRLVKVPGIGRKTAERLLLELKDKLGGPDPAASGAPATAEDASVDILQALLALGYSDKEARAATARLPAGVAVAEGIRQALRALSA